MNNFLSSRVVLGAALLLPLSAVADDIEQFVGVQLDRDPPNVLLVLDNAANFSANVASMRCSITSGGVVDVTGSGTAPTALDGTAGAVEQCALYSAIQALAAGSEAAINIGVMGFNATGMKQFNADTNTFSADCVSGTGGCLLMPIVPFNAQTKPNILEWIRNWQVSGGSNYNIKGSNSANGAVMQEAWAYFFGRKGVSGRSYASVRPEVTCGKNYVVFVGNAYRNNATPGDQTNEENSPLKPLNGTSLDALKRADPPATSDQLSLFSGTIATACGAGTLASGSNAEGRGAYALNWANYMRAQGIITYSIGVLGPTCNAEYAAHLTKLGASDVGGGAYFATKSFEELKAAFSTALSQIHSVNSAFASVSLPVSVNTQGTYLNQVYVGMFRPDRNFLPRWMGNLKQYKMGYLNGELKLLDADGEGAISGSGTGFISECARSYWTPENDDDYWGNLEDANCIGHPASSNTPDGNVVEKGAQGYLLRGASPSQRRVLTCGGSCGTTLANFETGNTAISKAALGDASMSDTDRSALINWARGLNNRGDETFVAATATRPSIHADIVHSRPVAVNYGTDAAPSVVVFYGGNDGMLRAVNGNRSSSITVGAATYAAGSELWSFVAPDSYSILKRQRDNAIPIAFRGSAADGALPKPYGFDGPVSAHLESSRKWIYAAMRRGGRMLYAFDVTTADSPTLKWRSGCPPTEGTGAETDAHCTGIGDAVSGVSQDMSGIGQTWSSPRVIKAAGYASGEPGTEKPMLIFGGGYDNCEDHDGDGKNNICTTASKGRKVYVLDADTGAVLAALPTDRGVVGDVTVVSDKSTGLAKYAYAADLGGNVYRITIGSEAPANWTITKIASLGCETTATCDANRKFMFAPDVVEESGTYVVLLGSGDREKPLQAYTVTTSVENYFFMVKDKPSDPLWLSSEATNCSGTAVMCLDSLLPIVGDAEPDPEQLAAKKGWYLGLRSSEQVVTSAITLFGVVTFSTHMPTRPEPGACSANLGTASVYNIRYLNAEAASGADSRHEAIAGGGLPPSPVAGRVTLDDGTTVPFVIGGDASSPLESNLRDFDPAGAVIQPKVRVYWYIQQ